MAAPPPPPPHTHTLWLTGNYTAGQQFLPRYASETEMQKTLGAAIWEGRRGGRRAERQSIEQIGLECNAMARQWESSGPKLTAVFSTFTARAVPFAGGGRTREEQVEAKISPPLSSFYLTRWLQKKSFLA